MLKKKITVCLIISVASHRAGAEMHCLLPPCRAVPAVPSFQHLCCGEGPCVLPSSAPVLGTVTLTIPFSLPSSACMLYKVKKHGLKSASTQASVDLHLPPVSTSPSTSLPWRGTLTLPGGPSFSLKSLPPQASSVHGCYIKTTDRGIPWWSSS